MKRILITGAAGNIGSALRKGLRGSYPLIRLLDVAPLGTPENGEELYTADICDAPALETAMAGIDCVVHLAGMPTEAPWEEVLRLNIEGCYNVFEAARRGGVRRIVFRQLQSCDWFSPPRAIYRHQCRATAGYALWRLEGVRRGRWPALRRQIWPQRRLPSHRQLSHARSANGRAPVAHLDQSSRHGAARAALHRLPGLSLRDRLRRLQQFAQSLGQFRTSSFSATGPRTIRRNSPQRSWRSANRRTKSRRSSTAASIRRSSFRATPQKSTKLAG